MNAVSGWLLSDVTIRIAATLTALAVIWRFLVMPVVKWWRHFKAWMGRIEAATSWTEQQMRPNGGSSLTDKVDKLTADVARLLDEKENR